MEKLYSDSQLIFVGEYTGSEKNAFNETDNRAVCCFKYKDVLKGPWLGSTPRIYYNSPPPELNSKWIIFVPTLDPIAGPWDATCGGKGIIEYTDQNIKLLNDAISKRSSRKIISGKPALRDGNLFVFCEPTEQNVDYYSKDPRFKSDSAILKKLYQESKSVVIATYEYTEATNNSATDAYPVAQYMRSEYLKGKTLARDPFLRVRQSPSKKGKATTNRWSYNPSATPEKGSKWLLFIPDDQTTDGIFDTLDGNTGRVPWDGWTYELIMRYIEMTKGCSG